MHSIPRRVEERADALRTRFLRWIYDLGEAQIDGKRLLDHLVLRPGFSYWWMTLLAEKSNAFNSLQIIDVVKLLALEDLIDVRPDYKIILASGDKTLALSLRLWCWNVGMAFEWQRSKGQASAVPLVRSVYRALPHPLQALAALLRHLGERWPLRKTGTKRLADSAAKVTFCSYLFNLSRSSAQSGRFYTPYWTELHNAIEHDSKGVNWLQLFIKHEATRRHSVVIGTPRAMSASPIWVSRWCAPTVWSIWRRVCYLKDGWASALLLYTPGEAAMLTTSGRSPALSTGCFNTVTRPHQSPGRLRKRNRQCSMRVRKPW